MNKQTLVFLELLTEPKSVGRVLSIRIKLYISIPKLNNWPWVLFNQYLNRSNLLLWLLTWWTHECLNNPVQPKNIHFVFNLIWISDNVAIVLTLTFLLFFFLLVHFTTLDFLKCSPCSSCSTPVVPLDVDHTMHGHAYLKTFLTIEQIDRCTLVE